ncbi:hypothetical protein, partial [Dendrosporobacter sp. 1207_IL3150]|uniref:hypothetical protein n=1 Tax=Dendrosporobacter sp. 1207_IL3150 TaxID=3084054 RepID=UPI002FDB2A70
FALGLLQIPPHGGHPCPLLTVPTAKPVVDSHHQVIAHSGQTTINAFLLIAECVLFFALIIYRSNYQS